MKELLISVVIPIYKVEKYLRECVESVLSQSYRNLEVILVDDGSPDGCPQICDDFANIDSRVKTIHKINGGLSDARNAGTAIASGDYIVYLDSDDYWSDKDAMAKLVANLPTNCLPDMIYFRRFTFIDGDTREVSRFPEFDISQINSLNYDQAIAQLIAEDRFIPSACNKMVKAELAKSTPFKKGIVSEDIDWNFALTLKAKSISVSNECFYAYRKRKTSITNTIGVRNIDCLLTIIEEWSEKLMNMQVVSDTLRNALLAYCTYQLSIVMGLIYSIDDKSCRNEFNTRVSRLKHLWKFDGTKKVKKVKMLKNVIGGGGVL